MRRISLPILLASILATTASAQFNQQWVTFQADQARLQPSATAISNATTEIDFAWGDLDHDGWTDLVVVRKEPVTTPGKRTNILLMNEFGVFVDRTVQYASSSDVSGDMGFLTATNDRDVILADLDGDGWDDLVTATTLSDGDPKHIGHPRVYMNLGLDGSGNWLGFRHEDARIPQLFTVGGLAVNPRFCSVEAGDVTGDGAPDLYFGDYDSSGAGGGGQPPQFDLNDRLLVNDGNGNFADESASRMSVQMLESAFGMAVALVDANGDGSLDVFKDSALNAPQFVSVSYNNTASLGNFNFYQQAHSFQPYHLAVGDLNRDGRPDMVVTDDADDRYRVNNGNDAFGRVIWSSASTFDFLSGGENDFGGNNLIRDLDADGWNDVIITDVDVDIAGCNRRTHIYHNLADVPVGGLPTLREERQSSGSGWIGTPGLFSGDLTGTHDVAVFDINNDGQLDMVLGRCTGTYVFTQPSSNSTKSPTSKNGLRFHTVRLFR